MYLLKIEGNLIGIFRCSPLPLTHHDSIAPSMVSLRTLGGLRMSLGASAWPVLVFHSSPNTTAVT